MTLFELSVQYRQASFQLSTHLQQLKEATKTANEHEKVQLDDQIRILQGMLRQTREIAVLTERYYDKGYSRNGKYTI